MYTHLFFDLTGGDIKHALREEEAGKETCTLIQLLTVLDLFPLEFDS